MSVVFLPYTKKTQKRKKANWGAKTQNDENTRPPKVQDSADSWGPNLGPKVFMFCAIFVGFQLLTDRRARLSRIGFWENWPAESRGFGRFVGSQLKSKCLSVGRFVRWIATCDRSMDAPVQKPNLGKLARQKFRIRPIRGAPT